LSKRENKQHGATERQPFGAIDIMLAVIAISIYCLDGCQ